MRARSAAPVRRVRAALAAAACASALVALLTLSARGVRREGSHLRLGTAGGARSLPRRAAAARSASPQRPVASAVAAAHAADLDAMLRGVELVRNESGATPAPEAGAAARAPPPPPPLLASPGFDWRAYLAYHPDLRAVGVRDEASAVAHYASSGRAAGRAAARLDAVVRYTACTGLINQHYSHIAALALATRIGADVVLPPAAVRDSFGSYFHMAADKNEMAWSAAPLDSLLDVDALVTTWRERGVTLHRPPALAPFPDLTRPATAFPAYAQPSLDTSLRARLDGVYLAVVPLGALVDRVRAAVVAAVVPALRADPDARLPPVVVDLPCSFFAVRTTDQLPLVSDVARTLSFAPGLVALADRVVAAAARASGGASSASHPIPPTLAPFNGVHLRLESDARDWATILGGPQALWDGYVSAMRRACFNASTPLYAASGLLTYGASGQLASVVAQLRRLGLADRVLYKEALLPDAALASLNSEQKAAVDFLVLARSRSFVGMGSSTFSFYLREHRALAGVPRATTTLLDASKIGTDALFEAAGHVV